MTDDEMTRLIAFCAEYVSIRETGVLWLDLAAAEVTSATQTLNALFSNLYAEMDEAFWELASHYDDGWDILRDATAPVPTDGDAT